ncbi:BTAD domain-containing putative transcriptional regulator [Saccharothrix obliqua]|uniref:BTAD domain-containing putative transcriptional regulator n=1 Tax=Saccharothrix obliqua TaxID=2861747 RepID=UPI001C5CEA59|nr:BTAD domain-containing putative transcriptional regulator [Saccharothrix obliqua]MBW4721413.1 AAA family ATPase [Saccharothrix obliqua]
MHGELRISVLGPVRAWLGDGEVSLGTARRRATFAALVGHAGEDVSFRELIDAVWGAWAPASAQGNVHTYVSGLRRALGPARDLLVTTPRGYRLLLDGADVDSTAFERRREEAGRRVLVGDLHGAVDDLTDGLALWRGAAYSGVPGPFAELEGQRLDEARLASVEQRAGLLIEAGHQADVVADVAALVREQPLRESAWELLVLALHACGRHAEALAAADDARRTLTRELGVAPGAKLVDLGSRVRADADRVGRAAVAPRRAPGPVVPAFVTAATVRPDPSADVTALRRLVSDVAVGRGRAVWIEGDVGAGKSALLLAGLADAGRSGCVLGWAEADELLGRFDLQVVLNCFDVDLTPGGRLAPGHEEHRVEDRLVELITRTCARSPLVLVVDDLHWADPATLRLWARLARAAHRGLPLLLVAATRPSRAGTELGRLRDVVADADGHLVVLTPPPGDIGTDADPPPSLWAPRPPGDDELRRLAARRALLALSAEAAAVVRTAAVLGVRFSEPDLRLVAGVDAESVRTAVDEAVTAQVLVVRYGALAFRTRMLWQAAYERIPGPIRTPLRRQFTRILTAGGTGRSGPG